MHWPSVTCPDLGRLSFSSVMMLPGVGARVSRTQPCLGCRLSIKFHGCRRTENWFTRSSAAQVEAKWQHSRPALHAEITFPSPSTAKVPIIDLVSENRNREMWQGMTREEALESKSRFPHRTNQFWDVFLPDTNFTRRPVHRTQHQCRARRGDSICEDG